MQADGCKRDPCARARRDLSLGSAAAGGPRAPLPSTFRDPGTSPSGRLPALQLTAASIMTTAVIPGQGRRLALAGLAAVAAFAPAEQR